MTIYDDMEVDLCDNCQAAEAIKLHECPYLAEIYQDYSPCNCCLSCTRECSNEI